MTVLKLILSVVAGTFAAIVVAIVIFAVVPFPEAAFQKRHDEILSRIALVHVEWRANFGVASASFTLVNGSNRWVSDLTLFCEFFAPSGTELGDVSPVLYQRVAPGRSLHVTGFTLGRIDPQVATARCNIIGFH